MGGIKKSGIFKVILFAVPFLLSPVLSTFFRIFKGAYGGEFQKTVYHIFFIFAFLWCLAISYSFKKYISAEKLRAVRSAYISVFLIYNAILIPIFLYF